MTTFMPILLTACGNTCVLDFNLTYEDCTSRLVDYNLNDTIFCEVEQ